MPILSKPDPFLVVGPGRCGMRSVAEMLNSLDKVEATVDGYIGRWNEIGPSVGDLIRKMCAKRDAMIAFGDVSFYGIFHLNAIRAALPNLKIVCVHRDMDECVKSYLEHWPCIVRPEDRRAFYERDREGFEKWRDAYPFIDGADAKQAWEFWWRYYKARMIKVKPPVLHVTAEALDEIRSFLNVG